MAFITCTIQEFHRFIGPFIRNRVNNLTSKARKERNGICEFCKEKKELQSAHIHGRERKTIIEEVLEDYLDDGHVKGILLKIEKKIMAAHLPLEETFKFLCQPCHREYDNQNPKTHSTIKNPDVLQGNGEFKKLYKIPGWAKRPRQINSRIITAFLEISKKKKVILEELEDLCKSEKYEVEKFRFRSNFSQMKTDIGNSNGKIFYINDDGFVEIYPIVMNEIKKYWPRDDN